MEHITIMKNFAILDFDSVKSAREAKKDLDGFDLKGKKLKIEFSTKPVFDPREKGPFNSKKFTLGPGCFKDKRDDGCYLCH